MDYSSFGLKDRVAIVTGASQGIGRAIAIGLAQAGAHLVLAKHPEGSMDADQRGPCRDRSNRARSADCTNRCFTANAIDGADGCRQVQVRQDRYSGE